MTTTQEPDILEVTLRDGSYAIDFQFTAQDTAAIGSALDAVGFRWIEVGHGLGLNASATGHGQAAATDVEYLEAAAESIQHARWGMFFIPGIGREEDLRLAAAHGMSFVRVGTNITEIDAARPFIELAKQLGMVVSYNAMKSYAVAAAEFGHLAEQAGRWGADIVCLVDSAGGMFPDTVAEYLLAASEHTDSRLGFHGHANLSLAIANTLRAIESGATLVDSSLQGLGRSAGNAVTEILVAILQQRSCLQHVDLNATMDVGQGLIRPVVRHAGADPISVTAGSARFHSSFMEKVRRYADRYQVDLRDMIVSLCKEDQVNAPEALLDRLGQELARKPKTQSVSIKTWSHEQPAPLRGLNAVDQLTRQLRTRAAKTSKRTTVNLVMNDEVDSQPRVSGNIQETPTHLIGSVNVSTDRQLVEITRRLDGAVDILLLDVDEKPQGPRHPARVARRNLDRTRLLTYQDGRLWVSAVEEQVLRLLGTLVDEACIVIAGNHPRSRLLSLQCAQRCATVTLLAERHTDMRDRLAEAASPFLLNSRPQLNCLPCDSDEVAARLEQADVVVVWPAGQPWFDGRFVQHVRPDVHLLDAGIGGISPDALHEARRRDINLIRVNIWPVLAGTLLAGEEADRIREQSIGRGMLAKATIVSGGMIGEKGDVIVDDFRKPGRVIGIANGLGGVLFEYDEQDACKVRRVAEAIRRRQVGSPSVAED